MLELLAKALWVNQPRRELILATIGCFFGTFILLAAVQFQSDAYSSMEAHEAPNTYFSLNKEINGSAVETFGKNFDFNDSEIKEIENHPEILEVGIFNRSRFPVDLNLWPAGKFFGKVNTNAFFESVPKDFIDLKSGKWDWKPGDEKVPIIIPKFYLDLWNLGFAPARGMPTLGADAALRTPIEIIITPSNKPVVTLEGNFTGFSQRINAILVPEGFLAWANNEYAPMNDQNMTSASRLIVKTDANPKQELKNYLKRKHYEYNREMPKYDGLSDVILWAFLIVGGIGVALSVLSVATFAVSFRLVVSRSSERIGNLLHLGFEHSQISRIYVSRFLRLFGIAFGASALALWLAKSVVDDKLAELSIEAPEGIASPTVAVAVFYAFLFAIANLVVIRNAVRKLD
ncbi:MAG: hypothetical protein CMI30_11235 [Opitutae bacterium]|nr:hypothetical protein [Opitutae bacterium]